MNQPKLPISDSNNLFYIAYIPIEIEIKSFNSTRLSFGYLILPINIIIEARLRPMFIYPNFIIYFSSFWIFIIITDMIYIFIDYY